MNIVSDFQDYYDIGLSLGIDKSLTYIRRTEYPDLESLIPGIKQKTGLWKPTWGQLVCSEVLHISPDFHDPHLGGYFAVPNSGRITAFYVGFCGKFYPMLRLRINDDPMAEDEYDFLYSEQDVFAALDRAPFNNKHIRNRREFWLGESNKKTDLELALMFVRKGPVDCVEPFAKFETPNMLICLNSRSSVEHALVVNTNLKDIKFYRCLDPYMAFQELSMFIGGVLGVGEPETITISDNDMRDAKGFDDRSFKKAPGKKRRKKK